MEDTGYQSWWNGQIAQKLSVDFEITMVSKWNVDAWFVADDVCEIDFMILLVDVEEGAEGPGQEHPHRIHAI